MWLDSVMASFSVSGDRLCATADIQHMRIDNQLPTTPFEVVLRREDPEAHTPIVQVCVAHRDVVFVL